MAELDLKTKILYDLYPDKEIYVGEYNNISATNELLEKRLIETVGENNTMIRLTKKAKRLIIANKTYEDFLRYERLPKYIPMKLIITPHIIKSHAGRFWFKMVKNEWFKLSTIGIIAGLVVLIAWFFLYPYFKHKFPEFDVP